jgi:hypothetical protein
LAVRLLRSDTTRESGVTEEAEMFQQAVGAKWEKARLARAGGGASLGIDGLSEMLCGVLTEAAEEVVGGEEAAA